MHARAGQKLPAAHGIGAVAPAGQYQPAGHSVDTAAPGARYAPHMEVQQAAELSTSHSVLTQVVDDCLLVHLKLVPLRETLSPKP